MKIIRKISAMILAMMFIGMGMAFAGKTEEVKIKTSAVCEMCKKKIEKALMYEAGMKKATVDVKTKECTVIYNPKKTSPEKIRLAISQAGYDADDVKANEKSYAKLDNCCKKGKVCTGGK